MKRITFLVALVLLIGMAVADATIAAERQGFLTANVIKGKGGQDETRLR